METKPQSQQRQAQETTPRAAHPRRRILTDLNKVNDTYKDSNSNSENLKEVYDKVNCLQKVSSSDLRLIIGDCYLEL